MSQTKDLSIKLPHLCTRCPICTHKIVTHYRCPSDSPAVPYNGRFHMAPSYRMESRRANQFSSSGWRLSREYLIRSMSPAANYIHLEHCISSARRMQQFQPDPEGLHYYTGLEDYAKFKYILSTLGHVALNHLNYYKY